MTIDKNKAVNIFVTLVITFVIFLIIQSLITRNTNLDLKNKPQNYIEFIRIKQDDNLEQRTRSEMVR